MKIYDVNAASNVSPHPTFLFLPSHTQKVRTSFSSSSSITFTLRSSYIIVPNHDLMFLFPARNLSRKGPSKLSACSRVAVEET